MNILSSPDQFEPQRGTLSAVVILNDFGWVNGGQSQVAIESALQLKLRGLDVHFVAGRGPLDERLVAAGIACHLAGSHDILSDPSRSRAAVTGIWNAAAARTLGDCLASLDLATTAIHVHGWAKALSPSIGPVVTGSQAAHVYTLHEYFLACPNGGFYNYQTGAICRLRALGAQCLATNCDARGYHHKLWRAARQAVLWNAGRMPRDLREIIYLAPEQLDIMGPYVPPQANWHFLPNPAGPRPAQRMAAEHNQTYLFVGRLSPEKGAVVAARAAADAGVPIAFCGDGEERDAVLSANPQAQMLGWLGQDELAAWMQRARCLVFPSLWYETYGLVVADALRIGLPVLVSRSCVAASLLEHGISGELVPAGDVQAWAAALSRLRSDELTAAYSEGAFTRGQGLPGQAEYTSRLIEIYTSAIDRKQRGPAPQLSEAIQ
ncbi:glycosyltransferase [Sphingomonas sp.]|uniref:glycosyltransferase n=1 Tax=Sphingomonas sp. TaxID=28214 RepID=UPI00286DCD8A|nr:glycosyltransferase [Sphingomonas sp.]